MVRRALIATGAPLLLLLAACSGGESSDGDKAEAATDGAEEVTPADTASVDTAADTTAAAPVEAPQGEGWTVMLYSIADTDLEPFLLVDAGEMAQVGSQDGLNLVALVDRAADYSADPLLNLPDWQGAKVMDVEAGSMTETADLGDVDTGDPALLAEFISSSIAAHPAAHYSLILSDHGASWPGVGGDESSGGNGLTVAEIQQAVSTGLADAGVAKLDLLGFDACLMSTYEVATSMAPLADRMLASQELEPGHGWDYTALQVLADDPSTTVDTLGSALIKGFDAQATAEGTQSQITLSLLDLTKIGALDEALGAFTGQMVDVAAEAGPIVGRTLASTLGFGQNPDPSADTHMADLGMLVSQIGVDALFVSDAADGVVRALNDVVVDSVGGAAMQGATGLSIYFPPTPELFDPGYGEVTANGGWMDFLSAYYGAGDAIAVEDMPSFTPTADGNAITAFDDVGVSISATFDPALEETLSEATISYGTVDADGTITYFGEEPADLAFDGTGSVSGSYDLTTLTISDGTDIAVAYLTMSTVDDSGTYTIDVPMAYYAPEDVDGETYQEVLLTLTVDAETGDIVDETYYAYNPENDTYGELTADPAGIIVPEVPILAADGTEDWAPTSDVGLFADLPNLQYDLAPLESGTVLHLELSLYDFGGNYSTISSDVQVP